MPRSVWGVGRPELVLVHGGFHGGWYWEVWRDLLERAGWRCRVVDFPGREQCRIADDEFVRLTFADYTQHIRRQLPARLSRTVLVGHSLGGLVAQCICADGAPAAAVLVCPSPPGNLAGPTFPLRALGVPAEPPSLAEMRQWWFHRELHSHFGTFAEVHRRLSRESPRALNDRYANRINVAPASCPTLVVGVATDERHLHGRVDTAIAEYHHGQLLLIGDHGHDICIESGTEEVAAYVADWLGSTV